MKGIVRTSLILAIVITITIAAYYFWAEDTFLYSAMCQAGEKPIICLRGWINPLAAVFTFIAIWYAAKQVTEARQQSLASTRESLVLMRNDLNETITSVLSLWDELVIDIPFYKPEDDLFSSDPEYYSDPKDHIIQLIRNNVGGKNVKRSIRKIIYNANVNPNIEKMLFDIEGYATSFNPYYYFPGFLSIHQSREDWDLMIWADGEEKGGGVQACEVDGVEYEYLLDPSDEVWAICKEEFFEFDQLIKNALKELLVEKRMVNIALSKIDTELSVRGREIVEKARSHARETKRDIRL